MIERPDQDPKSYGSGSGNTGIHNCLGASQRQANEHNWEGGEGDCRWLKKSNKKRRGM
jgi:hypothetical protein